MTTAPVQYGSFDAEKLAEKIWHAMSAAYGGHSQVPTTAYAEGLIGHCNNNIFQYGNVEKDAESFYFAAAKEIARLYDEQWLEGNFYTESAQADFLELQSSLWKAGTDFMESMKQKGYFG